MLWYQVMTEFSIKFNHKNKCASINLEFTDNIIRSWAKGFHQHIKLIHQQDTTSLLYQFIFPTNVSTANFNYSLMCFIVTLNPSIYSRLVQKLCWEINHLDGCLIGWKTMIRNRLLNYSSCKNRPAKFRCQKSGENSWMMKIQFKNGNEKFNVLLPIWNRIAIYPMAILFGVHSKSECCFDMGRMDCLERISHRVRTHHRMVFSLSFFNVLMLALNSTVQNINMCERETDKETESAIGCDWVLNGVVAACLSLIWQMQTSENRTEKQHDDKQWIAVALIYMNIIPARVTESSCTVDTSDTHIYDREWL